MTLLLLWLWKQICWRTSLIGFLILEPQGPSVQIETCSISLKILPIENLYSWVTLPLQKLIFGKTLSLSNVLILSSFGRNLVFGNLLNRVGIRIVFEVDKVPISNLMNVSVSNSAYIVESIDVRHVRLSHVNFTSIKKKT